VILEYHGKRVRLPSHVTIDLDFISRSEAAFTSTDLPGPLNEAGRLTLLKRLVREGFLTLEPIGKGSTGENP
jgi:arginase family enzyme